MRITIKIAYGGIAAALCSVMLIITGYTAAGQYAAAFFAGIIILCTSYITGRNYAVYAFVVSVFLSFILCTNRQGILLYGLLLGYYPTVRGMFKNIKPLLLKYLLKILIAAASGLIYVLLYFFVFGYTIKWIDTVDFIWISLLTSGYVIVFFIYDRVLDFFEKRYRKKIFFILERIIKNNNKN